MQVTDVVETIVETYPDAVLVSSLGTATSAVLKVSDDGPHFYHGAAMGSAVPSALGLAEAVPDKQIVAVVGDGDLLMGMSSLWSLSAYPVSNLIVVVLEDGAYSITGGQSLSVPLHVADVANTLDHLSGGTAVDQAELRTALKTIGQPGIISAQISKKVWPGPSPFVNPARVSWRVRDALRK
ncbi:thiamine pyrophosphate-dependent enzyme [Nonomuraea sp. NPDC049750]|uniref:thiamine pyrophosphate-dependent enzyme n=1 Tax=Nonomuraea sp. NPDC049750 TaxID=3154738 RepID=UPI0033C2C9EE